MANKLVLNTDPESGNQGGQDPTEVSGQDPSSLFGIPVSYDSGAAGTPAPGGEGLGTHDVSMPNQYPSRDPISGVTLGGSGAPGSQGVPDSDVTPAGATGITVTDPNYTAGRPGGGSGVQMLTVNDAVSGTDDWTATQSNYPPGNPVVSGDYYPTSTGAGSGRVRRGGFMNGRR